MVIARVPKGTEERAPLLERVGEIADELSKGGIKMQDLKLHGEKFLHYHNKCKGSHGLKAFTSAAYIFADRSNIKAEEALRLGRMAKEMPVLDLTKKLVQQRANSIRYALSLIFAASCQQKENASEEAFKTLRDGTHRVSRLALPGELTTVGVYKKEAPVELVSVPSNHLALYKNLRDNYVRLLTGQEVSYDELHRRNMYLFTTNNSRTPFADKMVTYYRGPSHTSLIQDKHVMEIGAGNGADPQYFLEEGRAASVTVIDGSELIHDRLEYRREHLLDKSLADRLILPPPNDMFKALEQYRDEGQTFDTIVSHSSIHYFDDATVERLLALVKDCLTPEGHFAFCVKAPGATLDGEGICLINDVEPHKYKKDQQYVRNRAWMNPDGQMRFFRSEERWEALVEPCFEVKARGYEQIDDYEAPGQGEQKFYVFVCRPKSTAEHALLKDSRTPVPGVFEDPTKH